MNMFANQAGSDASSLNRDCAQEATLIVRTWEGTNRRSPGSLDSCRNRYRSSAVDLLILHFVAG